MRALIAPCGTYGDIVGPLNLALKLRELGYEIRIASSESFRSLFESRSFEFHSVGLDFQDELRTDRDAQGASARLRFASWGKLIERELSMQSRILPDLASDVDIIVGSGLLYMGPSIAELHDLPYIQVCHIPTAIPSADHAPYVIKYRRRPRWANRALWALSRFASLRSFVPLLDKHRKTIGLPPISDYGAYYEDGVILAADKALFPLESLSGSTVFNTGYWQAPPSGALPERLRNFIDAGEKPIYIGFGSMAGTANEEIHGAIRELVMAGRRLILGGDLAAAARGYDDRSVIPAAEADHRLLFPLLSLAVHHGGAGTIHNAAIAGIPQVVVPHLMDQYYWAARVESLGIGIGTHHPSRLRRRELTAAILKVESEGLYARNARDLADRMENGEIALSEGAGIVIRIAERGTSRGTP